ncbi:helix-turn-helix transcriptional regulator [Solwaraspora sp. WMMD406]|uniref:helix-turn-helix domain-containing protein n=1 Tax=Solwaraspora sp. WMMD406 TaxID=3016095 RepID=UPI002416D4C5|nr:helix-turn-helix transcriptional regulator [Solwaraspora sp. WMMD406]MDG4766161.1 helix-turn-helix transcriptional regulator [Solwaraspora sp. WMMD406]
MDDAGSTVPRRQLGRYLRELREDAHVTVAAAAKALEWSPPRIWRYEGGQVPIHPNDAEAMCRLYGAPPETITTMRDLARETKSRGWYHSYDHAIKEWFKLYVGLEAAASTIRKYEPNVIPGLLQSLEYMTEIITTGNPDLSPADHQAKIEVRSKRQKLLARVVPQAPDLDVVIGEAALLRPMKDRAAMARQLRHLAAVATQRHNVTVRVLTFAAGLPSRPAVAPFSILTFPKVSVRPPEPTTVYSDGPCGAVYLDKPTEIEVYEGIWSSIKQHCLTPLESTEFITRIAKEYDDEG